MAIAGVGLGADSGQAPQAQTPPRPAQQAQAPAAQQPRQNPRAQVPMDPERARQLYVSKDPKDQSLGTDYQADIAAREKDAARYPELCKGIIDFKIVKYRSSVGDLDIPAYLFQPIQKRGPKGHAAMVWVHGGVHGNWGITHVPVREGGRRARLRDHRARLPRQHRLRRGVPPGDRLRRQGSGRHDLGGGLPEDAALRRSGAHRHHGLEPRRLHHADVGLPRAAPVRGRRGHRPGDEPGVPAVVQGAELPVGLLDAEGDPGAAVREAGRSTSSARRSTTWTT